jgi:hypothetical protein
MQRQRLRLQVRTPAPAIAVATRAASPRRSADRASRANAIRAKVIALVSLALPPRPSCQPLRGTPEQWPMRATRHVIRQLLVHLLTPTAGPPPRAASPLLRGLDLQQPHERRLVPPRRTGRRARGTSRRGRRRETLKQGRLLYGRTPERPPVASIYECCQVTEKARIMAGKPCAVNRKATSQYAKA